MQRWKNTTRGCVGLVLAVVPFGGLDTPRTKGSKVQTSVFTSRTCQEKNTTEDIKLDGGLGHRRGNQHQRGKQRLGEKGVEEKSKGSFFVGACRPG